MPFYTKTNKPIKNYQKKKYYTNRNVKIVKEKVRIEYYYNPLTREWKERIINHD